MNRNRVAVAAMGLLLVVGAVAVVLRIRGHSQNERFQAILSSPDYELAKLQLEVASMIKVGTPAKRYRSILAAATFKDDVPREGVVYYGFGPAAIDQEDEGDPCVTIVVDTKTDTIKSVELSPISE
jgi:hypothetical protein